MRLKGTLPFLLLSIRLFGQDTPCSLTLRGQVIDEHDRTSLGFASVLVKELPRTVEADAEGHFMIAGLCPGRYTLRVSHLDCEPVERIVDLSADRSIDIRLEHHEAELKELEVARERPDEHVGQAHQEIDRSSMEKASGRSLAEMLATIPGVTTLNSGPTIGKPVIHGLSGNRVLTLNQGIRQEDQQWGTEHAPNLDPFSSDRVTVVKGAASVQYGSDALGGVVITEPVELPREKGLGGEVRGIGLYNGRGGGGGGLLQGGVGAVPGLGWRVQGSGRYIGDSQAADYVLSNTGLREYGGSASVGMRVHRWDASVYYSYFQRELGILKASHIGNLTDLNNSIASGEPWVVDDFTHDILPPRQFVQHHLFKAEAGHVVGERGRIVLTYGYQADDRQEYDTRRGGRSGIPAIDLFLVTRTADIVYKHWLGNKVHGKVGVSGLQQENINVPGTGIRPLIPDYERSNIGAFVLEHLPLTDRLELEAGARVERTRLDVSRYTTNNLLEEPRHDFHNSAVSVGANWTLREALRLRANISTAYRPPHVSELYSEGLHHGAAAIERGNSALTSERSVKGTLDLEGTWLNDRLRTDITVYADRIGNYIYLRPEGVQLTIRGAFPVFSYVATDAMLQGCDATVQYRLTERWALRSRTSVVRGRDQRSDEWLFQMPSDRTEGAIVFGPGKAQRWSGIEVVATSAWVFRQSRFPVGVDFTDPPATYHLLGLSASATRSLGKNEVRVGVQANNLLDTAYRDYMDRFRYYADARGLDLTVWVRYSFGKNA